MYQSQWSSLEFCFDITRVRIKRRAFDLCVYALTCPFSSHAETGANVMNNQVISPGELRKHSEVIGCYYRAMRLPPDLT